MPTYRETLRLPAGWWLGGAFFALSVGWIFLVVGGQGAALISGVIAGVPTAAALWNFGTLSVEIEDGSLFVGTAVLESRFRGTAEALDATAFRFAMGAGADARAFLKIRPYIKTGVLIPVVDPADPAPHWIISTRRPEQLAAALNAPVQDQPIGGNPDVP